MKGEKKIFEFLKGLVIDFIASQALIMIPEMAGSNTNKKMKTNIMF